jgi:hypothetical protein
MVGWIFFKRMAKEKVVTAPTVNESQRIGNSLLANDHWLLAYLDVHRSD